MQTKNKQYIAHSPVFCIGALPRSSIESAFDMIRGPAVADLKSNGIKNPREDITTMEHYGSSPEGTGPLARGDREHALGNLLCMICRRTTLFQNARSDIAMQSVQYQLYNPVVYEESNSPPARGDTEHTHDKVLCMIRGRTTLFRNARSDIAMQSVQYQLYNPVVYEGSNSPPARGDTEHEYGTMLCCSRGRATLFRNARSDIAMRSKRCRLYYPFVYEGSSPPISNNGNSTFNVNAFNMDRYKNCVTKEDSFVDEGERNVLPKADEHQRKQ